MSDYTEPRTRKEKKGGKKWEPYSAKHVRAVEAITQKRKQMGNK